MKTNKCKRGEYLPIKSWPESEKPREKLLKYGSEYLSSCELLAIMLRSGINNGRRSSSALDIAKKLLSGYKNLNGLLGASTAELTAIKGVGPAKAAQ